VNKQTDTLTRERDDANHCFVCGPDNPAGLQVSFRLEEGLCKAEYTASEYQCGYDGVTHGGIIFSLLDDVMANWLFLRGERAYTGKCDIRYREPVATGTRMLLEGEQLSRKGRYARMAARLRHPDDGRVLAEAAATFVVMA
jgi:acyl-coenzyme A thioesterase PaaI-like protein